MRIPIALRRSLAPVLACAPLLSCTSGGDTILIGTAGPFKEAYATMVRHAVEMAADEVNARGGIHGRRLEVLAVDDEGDGVKAGAVARGFYDNPDQAKQVIDRHQALMWEVGDLMGQWEALQEHASES